MERRTRIRVPEYVERALPRQARRSRGTIIDRNLRLAYLSRMRQSLFFRLVGALLVSLYATGAWIAPALKVCPMHGSPAVAHVIAQMGAYANDAPSGEYAHGCDCIGCCASSNGPAVPATALAHATPVDQNTVRTLRQECDAVITRIAHVLPFATAPPSTLV